MVRLIAGHIRLILIVVSVTSLLALTLSLVEIPHNALAIVGMNLRTARSSRQENMVAGPEHNGHDGINWVAAKLYNERQGNVPSQTALLKPLQRG